MAIINYKGGEDPILKNQFGSVTGVELTAPVTLNNNPLDVKSVNGYNPEDVTLKWSSFYNFLKEKNINTDINSKEGYEKISLQLINEFNTKIVKYPSRIITRADIEAVQRFNQKTDPNVIIDGWVGTQTIQLQYPPIKFILIEFSVYEKNKFVIYKVKNYPSNSVIPILWGNKRFIISLDDFNKSNSSKTSSYPFWKLYDPVRDKNNLPWNALGTQLKQSLPSYKQWDELDNTINIENTLSINQQTLDLQQQKSSLQSQTKLTNLVR